MSLRTTFTAIRRSFIMGLSVAAIGALGLTAFSGAAQARPFEDGAYAAGYGDADARDYSDRSHRGLARCDAAARRLLGKVVRGTEQSVQHRRIDKACELALMDCRTSLENLRRAGKKFIRTAKCKVQKREHAIATPVEYRCEANAFSRRGAPMSRTRAIRVRADERRACAAALASCERRLDAKRWNDGRHYPYASCEVTRSREIAAAPDGVRNRDQRNYQTIDYRY